MTSTGRDAPPGAPAAAAGTSPAAGAAAREPAAPEPDAAEAKKARPLDGHEHQAVEEREAVGPHVVHEAIRREGEDELSRATAALAWSGVAAGLSMGFSLAAEGLLRQHLPDASWAPLLTKLGYPVGFLIVILGRQQLFTENTLTAVLPLLTRRDRQTARHVARLWGVVLVANLFGALAFAAAASRLATFEPATRAAFEAIGLEALGGGWGALAWKGVFAGWLIALVVWLLPGAGPSRAVVIVVLTYLIGVAGFPHIVAGAVEVLYVVTAGAATPTEFLRWASATLLGNVAGGLTLVTLLNHAQVVAGGGRGAHPA